MMCLICHGTSKYMPRYECGHHFHAECLQEWCKHTNRKNVIESNNNEKHLLDYPTKVNCPYCSVQIRLIKKTRTNSEYIYFQNNLAYLLATYHYQFTGEHNKLHGYCERCYKKDKIIEMKTVDDDEFLCNKCISRAYKYDPMYSIYEDSNKDKEEILLLILRFVWENRKVVRKNLSLINMSISKSEDFLNQMDPLHPSSSKSRKPTDYDREITKISNKIISSL